MRVAAQVHLRKISAGRAMSRCGLPTRLIWSSVNSSARADSHEQNSHFRVELLQSFLSLSRHTTRRYLSSLLPTTSPEIAQARSCSIHFCFSPPQPTLPRNLHNRLHDKSKSFHFLLHRPSTRRTRQIHTTTHITRFRQFPCQNFRHARCEI